MKRNSIVTLLAGAAWLLCSCATGPQATPRQQVGESVIFIGQEPAALAYLPVPHSRIRVRSTFLPAATTVEYQDGRDYEVDYVQGTLRRTANSRLPDFRRNVLYGQEDFDHSRFPGFSNNGFFGFVDYSYTSGERWPVQAVETEHLKRTRAKLAGGEAVKIVAFGDSITAGLDVPNAGNVFWNRWAEGLRRKYPAARITVQNGATSGDTTAQGLERLKAKVLDEHPDLVLIGFGMNDHNRSGVPVPQFQQNLQQMVERIRQATGAEVILYSCFPPNPKWRFGSHHMADYAAATQQAARESGCAYADVFNNWQRLAARKKPEDLLGNDINHPNEFGHWIYASVLNALGL